MSSEPIMAADVGHAFSSGASGCHREKGVEVPIASAPAPVTSGGTLSEREEGTGTRPGHMATPTESERGASCQASAVRPPSRSESVPNPPGRPREHDWPLMQALHGMGLSYYRIGKLLGVNHTVVMYACDPDFRARRKANRGTYRR